MSCVDAVELLKEISGDKGVPKNIKEMIEQSVFILNCKKSESEKVSSVVSILDEAANDPNVLPYTRTQIWNIVSILESSNW